MVLLPGVLSQVSGGAFNPETDITWHSLFWAEGTDFVAQSYSDGADVSPWPNETGESDATEATAANKPHYTASTSNLNNQPSVTFTNSAQSQLATAAFTANPSYSISIVAIAAPSVTTNQRHLVDGISSGNRNVIGCISTTGKAGIYAGFTREGSASTWTTGGHLYVGYFRGNTSNATLDVDNSEVVNVNSGSETLTGLSIGRNVNATNRSFDGDISLVGIYEGDITADGSWADFKTWVTDHYGITLS